VKVTGTATLNATPERVWAALNDPAVLVRTIPGCEQLEALGADRYRMTVTAGVASIKGTYLGDVELTDPVPPTGFTLRASGAGAPGTVSADVRVTLDDAGDGRTLLTYAADAVVGGPVGGVGQRVLGGVAKKTAGEFFRAVDAVLAERPDGDRADGALRVAVPGQAAPPLAEIADGAPSIGEVVDVVNGGSGAGVGQEPPRGVFTRPAAAPTGTRRVVPGQGADLGHLGAVALGAAIALVGVWLGDRLASRRR